MRILLVDDFEPYRSSVAEVLRKCDNLIIVGEAGDGIEAVEKAQQLLPDVILMDLHLPRLDGFAAARQIRELVPASKIIFLSQERNHDMANGALQLGASAYVLKQRGRRDLLAAIAAVREGKSFFRSAM